MVGSVVISLSFVMSSFDFVVNSIDLVVNIDNFELSFVATDVTNFDNVVIDS